MLTVSLKRGRTTVSVVLAVAPVASVAVIVVTPGRMPVARPAPSIVATVASLLLHVIPAPLIGTGLPDPVVVPLPN